jgi:nucleotide-binding universal stress UspA family protein
VGGQLAFERALRLPLHPKAKLTVLHVVPDDIPGRLRKQAISESLQGLEKLLAREKKALVELGLSPAQVVLDVLEGDATKQIVKRARTVEADVIVLGRHGRRPVVDLFVGSTAQKLVRASEVPVLLVQLDPTTEYRSVVAGIDLEQKPAAVLRATQLVSPGATARALNASQVPFEEYVTLSGELTPAFRDELLADARKAVKAVIAKTGVPAVAVVKPGDPRLLLLDEVREAEATLVVVGTRAKKGLKRLFLGSVAEWVLDHVTCDVLVVRS